MPTLVCSVACKAPWKCFHIKLIYKSEFNLLNAADFPSAHSLASILSAPNSVWVWAPALCKNAGKCFLFHLWQKQFYLQVQTLDSDAVAFSPYSSAACFFTLLTSVASIEKCIKFFSLICNKYLIHNWTQVWVFSALTFYNLSCLLWWVQTLSIY